MHDPENNFPPELIDQQVEQPDTRLPRGEARLIHDLQAMYNQEKSAAIERVWARMAHHRDAASQQKESLPLQELRRGPARSSTMTPRDVRPKPQKRFARALSLSAAILICVVLVGSLALVLRLTQHATTGTGSLPVSTITPGTTETSTSQQEGMIIARWSAQLDLTDLRSFSWSSNSQFIAADSQDNLQIRDATTGKNKRTITPGGLFAAWSPNNRYIAIDSRIYDATTGALVRDLIQSTALASPINGSALSATLPSSGGSGVYTIAWSPDSSLLAGAVFGPAYGGNKVVIWNASTGKVVSTFLGQSEDSVGSLAWSPDGKYVASASFDGVIKVWDARTGNVIFHHSDNARVAGLAWSHTGMRLAFFSNDSTIQVWNVATNTKITSYSTTTTTNALPAWSPDDTRIASANNNNVNIWDSTTGTTIYTFTQHKNWVSALAWSPDGKYIVSGSMSSYPGLDNGTPTPVPQPNVDALVWLA
jgi:hypothetical protein